MIFIINIEIFIRLVGCLFIVSSMCFICVPVAVFIIICRIILLSGCSFIIIIINTQYVIEVGKLLKIDVIFNGDGIGFCVLVMLSNVMIRSIC